MTTTSVAVIGVSLFDVFMLRDRIMVLMGSIEVLREASKHLPGMVTFDDTKTQWITPGGRMAEISCLDGSLSAMWTHRDHQMVARLYPAKSPLSVVRALKAETQDLAFSSSFEPLSGLSGSRFRAESVSRVTSSHGINIMIASVRRRRAHLELRHTVKVPAQIRERGGVFRRNPNATGPIVEDLWGSTDELHEWFEHGRDIFLDDPDCFI